jgi:trk system potassium uptake protein TrkA
VTCAYAPPPYTSIDFAHVYAEVKVRPKFVGKTLRQLDFRRTHGVNVVAMRSSQTVKDPDGRERTEWILNDLPDADDVIREGDVLVVIGSDDSIVALQTEL